MLSDCGALPQLPAVWGLRPAALADQAPRFCTSPTFSARFRSSCAWLRRWIVSA